MSWVVRRVVQPLDQLNAASSQLTADTLATAKLQLGTGPIEVMQLSRTYNPCWNGWPSPGVSNASSLAP